MHFKSIFLVVFSIITVGLIVTVNGRKLSKCDLAKELKKFNIQNVEEWVCLANAETRGQFRTDFDEHYGFGIFQIPPRYCGFTSAKRGLCRTSCLRFMDSNIADDIYCVQKILKKEGFEAWRGWELRCKDKNVKNILKECSAWSIGNVLNLPKLSDYIPTSLSDLL